MNKVERIASAACTFAKAYARGTKVYGRQESNGRLSACVRNALAYSRMTRDWPAWCKVTLMSVS